MKRILILSEYFAPQNAVASIRATKIAKYLYKDKRYQIYIATKSVDKSVLLGNTVIEDIKGLKNIIRCNDCNFTDCIRQRIYNIYKKYSTADKISSQNNVAADKKIRKDFKEIIKANIKFVIQLICDLEYQRKLYLQLKDLKFDYIFSTYGSFPSHLIAYNLKKKNKKIKWIADFRDPVIYDKAPRAFVIYARWFKNKIESSIDCVTAVSQGCIRSLDFNVSKLYVLYNGYDNDDLINVPRYPRVEAIKFCYCGQLYAGKQDITPFFKAIKEFIEEGVITYDHIQFEYAGKNSDEFIRQAKYFGLENSIKQYGYVSRDTALAIEANSDILLLSSLNNIGYTGVITGKFYEYLLMRKPIVCIVSGNLADSELRSMINEARIGICFENANANDDYPELKAYLKRLINQHYLGLDITPTVNEEYIKQFDYKNITQKLIGIIEDLDE